MNAVELEIYRHLFASIAEEMGVVLMRASFSPNIKERRDFSCAIFDGAGEMVAQAAHIPVHLGSTPMSVAAAMAAVELAPGDHVILNDPFSGGTHLPDITLVSPVFDDAGELKFLVANRAHHADVGGKTPGSLSLVESVEEEGICLGPMLFDEGVEERIAAASRTPEERRGDLRAQLAANRRGILRLGEELERRGEQLLRAAGALQDYSERFMREILRGLPRGAFSFRDALEGDGLGSGPLEIVATVEARDGGVVVDFTETVDQVRGPVNVPKAVTVSATLYAFQCLAGAELPTNGGAMRCIEVKTRPGSLVDARWPAAVALGNVETSQRITDVVFGALAQALPEKMPAASCGTMNNLTIGGVDHRTGAAFAYYETIGGGSGASPEGRGASAIQTHMTNTLNTPVEALEHAYPFRITRYEVRRGSGGSGEHVGGDGVVREYTFTGPATVSVMTERRSSRPYGLCGGGPGSKGQNLLIRAGSEAVTLDAKVELEVGAGDRLVIKTPGGGGWGSPPSTRTAAAARRS